MDHHHHHLIVTLLVSLTIVLSTLTTLGSSNAVVTSSTEQPIQLIRQQFQLPKLFDFEQFKALFHRKYNTLLEEIVRRKLFLGRAFQAFASAVSYKHWRSSFYLKVNEFSDWTKQDIERSKLKREDLVDLSDSNEDETEPEVEFNDHNKVEFESSPMADLDEIEEEIEEINKHKNEPGFREMAQELKEIDGGAVFRSSLQQYQSEKVVDGSTTKPDVELTTPTVDEKDVDYQAPKHNPFGFVHNIANAAMSLFNRKNNDVNEDFLVDRNWTIKDMEGPDAVFVDHRESQCFTLPRGQSSCGCCYAFSTIALYEWMYCNQTENKEKITFSEQYFVDCGKSVGLSGCKGGALSLAQEFVEQYGLEVRKNYPYRSTEETCPFGDNLKPKQLGHMRLSKVRRKRVNWKHLDQYLANGPIVVGFQLSPSFRAYGGGVHTNMDCRLDDAHAMLLVGSGREDNRKYWLLRNSHSITWGENGYYKIDQMAFARCLLEKYFYQISAKIEANKEAEKRTSSLKARYSQYLNHTSKRAPKF